MPRPPAIRPRAPASSYFGVGEQHRPLLSERVFEERLQNLGSGLRTVSPQKIEDGLVQFGQSLHIEPGPRERDLSKRKHGRGYPSQRIFQQTMPAEAPEG